MHDASCHNLDSSPITEPSPARACERVGTPWAEGVYPAVSSLEVDGRVDEYVQREKGAKDDVKEVVIGEEWCVPRRKGV